MERKNSESLIEGESFDQATKILNSIRDELISKVSVVEIGLVSQAFAFFDGEYRHRYCLIPTMAGKIKRVMMLFIFRIDGKPTETVSNSMIPRGSPIKGCFFVPTTSEVIGGLLYYLPKS